MQMEMFDTPAVEPEEPVAMPTDISGILEGATIENNIVKLNCGDLDRDLYEKVNTVLTRLWGKWNRKAGGHIFKYDPTDSIAEFIRSGKLPPKNELAYFPTPKLIIDDIKNLVTGSWPRILEPSAGQGAIAEMMREHLNYEKLDCIEMSELNIGVLNTKGFDVAGSDFLKYQADERYDLIVMNPPFSVKGDKLAFVTHIEKAYKLHLKPYGKLVAIVPPSIMNNSDKRLVEFMRLVGPRCEYCIKFDGGTFKDSGTMIETYMLVLYGEGHFKDMRAADRFTNRFSLYVDGSYGREFYRGDHMDMSPEKYVQWLIDRRDEMMESIPQEDYAQCVELLKEWDKEYHDS